MAGATVKLSRKGRVQAQRTVADGGFTFLAVAPGRYTVSVAPPSGFTLAGEEARTVTVQGGKTSAVSFALAAIEVKPTATPAPSPTAAASSAAARPAGLSADARSVAQAEPTPVRPAASPGPAGPATPAGLFAPAARPSPGTPVTDAASGPLSPAAAVEGRSPAPSPVPDGLAFAPVRTVSAVAEAAPAARTESAASASPDDILAGRGLHWRPDGIATSGSTPASAASPVNAAATAALEAARATQPRRVVTSFEAVRGAAGQAAAQVRSWANDSALWLGVPFRTQIDGTEYSQVNCGPASLAMALAAFGLQIDPAALRDYVNFLSGDYSTDDGTSLDVLARVAREAGLNTLGLHGGGGYRTWSVEAVREHIRAGHPVITLVKYRSLPGNGGSLAEFDHYIVITGLSGNDLIYNDSAFATEYGFNLLISPEDLERAWSYSSIPRHAVAVGLGSSLRPLPNLPSRVTAASLALGPEAIQEAVEPPLAMLPGTAAQWLRERSLAERGAGAVGDAELGAEMVGDDQPILPPAPESTVDSAALFPKVAVEGDAAARASVGSQVIGPDVVVDLAAESLGPAESSVALVSPAEATVADAVPARTRPASSSPSRSPRSCC